MWVNCFWYVYSHLHILSCIRNICCVNHSKTSLHQFSIHQTHSKNSFHSPCHSQEQDLIKLELFTLRNREWLWLAENVTRKMNTTCLWCQPQQSVSLYNLWLTTCQLLCYHLLHFHHLHQTRHPKCGAPLHSVPMLPTRSISLQHCKIG